MCLEDVRDR
jgi:hypothetical protein